MNARQALGRLGEDEAARLYRRAGFTIVERNYRCKLGEMDVVARRGNLLVFCEVKARRTDYFGIPAEAVNHAKQARLRRLAAEWMRERRPGRVEVRFDVVSVIVGPHGTEVTHLPDAF
jgi:putative endonuclease